MEEDESHTVQLYIYDLTHGMAAGMSQLYIGRHIEAIWHTAVVVYGKEYFYGGHGITSVAPGGTVLGQPGKIQKIGDTFIPFSVFKDYLRGLSETTFKGSNYSLLHNNCNNFSNELCQFLCGIGIPKNILDLPQEFLSTPLGGLIGPLLDRLGGSESDNRFLFEPQITARETSPGFDDLNSEIEQARLESLALEQRRQSLQDKINKKEKKKDKKRRKQGVAGSDSNGEYNSNSGMSEIEQDLNGADSEQPIPSEMLPSERALKDHAREMEEEEERRKNREPPIVFHDIDPKIELEELVKLIDGNLNKDEEVSIEEMHQYLIENEGSWALGDGFLIFVGRVLRDPTISTETRVHLIRALAAAALKDDVILILHQDRRDHVLMNFAQDIDRHPPEIQQAWALFMCNLFENISSSEWLLYISEWPYNNQQTSNIRATTKVAVHCLLSPCPTLQDIGTSIIYNLAIKEVFDDVAVEITMAILQFFNNKPTEEHLFRTMKALARFVQVSPDVPQFVQMIGPPPTTFKGASSRVDDLIAEITKKLR